MAAISSSNNYAEAAKWARKAAEQGYALAQADLGVMYWNGQGVPQDAVLSVHVAEFGGRTGAGCGGGT